MDALARTAPSGPFYGFGLDVSDSVVFSQSVAKANTELQPVLLTPANMGALSGLGSLYWPSPMINRQAEMRRLVDPAGWSILGVTHSLAGSPVVDAIEQYLTGDAAPYDALVCTSSAARDVVEHTLDVRGERLRERFGGIRLERPQLPIIPLGIDTKAYAPDADARAAARAGLGPLTANW